MDCFFRTIVLAVLSIRLTMAYAVPNDQAGNSEIERAHPADIIEPPAYVTEAIEGTAAAITCRISGSPYPRVSWEKDGQIINDQLGNGSRYEIKRNGDLLIYAAIAADAGNYTCEANNRFGIRRASGRLDIKSKTMIKTPPVDTKRVAGESATFHCSAESDPSLEVQIAWALDDEPLPFRGNSRVFQSNTSSLTISSVREVDSGVYKCTARTRLDQAEASALLVVRDVPNPPINVRVQCDRRTAVVSWEPNGDNREPILEYLIQYSTSFLPGEWAVLKASIPSTNLSTSLDLSPWVNYAFRVIARNAIGMSNASAPSEEVCSTPPDVPYKNPDNIQGKGNRPDNFIITWTPMPQIDHNGPGFYYEVRYIKADDIDHLGQRVEDVLPIKDWRQGSVTLVDQPPHVAYDVRVIAINDFGVSRAANDPPVRGFSGGNVSITTPAHR